MHITNLTLKEKMVCIIWLLVAVMSLIFFHFSFDPSVMIISGNMLLDGHILDYYEELEKIMGSAGVYPILCPLFYTIWNIPVRILTGTSYVEFGLPFALELWNKLLPVLFYVLTGLELGKIIDELNLNEDKYTKKVWFFMPISFFVVFIMGMYDIFYAFFAVVGLRFYFKDWSNRRNKLLFIFFFGIAICFKTFPLFFFIALLLSKEKNIRKIICDLIVFIIPYIICALPFIRSDAFINNCLMFSGNASGMLLVTTVGNLNVMLVLAVILYGYSYFEIRTDNVRFEKQVILVCNFIGVCLYGLSDFHFQWLVLFVPFLTLLFIMNRDTNFEAVYVLQVILMVALLGIHLTIYDAFEYFFSSGLLGDHGLQIIHSGDNYWTIRNILHLGDNSIIYKSISLAIMLVLIFYGSKEKERKNETISVTKLTAMLIVPILIYEVLAVLCYLPIAPKYIYGKNNMATEKHFDGIWVNETQNVSQKITVTNKFELSKIQFKTIHWDNTYDENDTLLISIIDSISGESLAVKEYKTSSFLVDGEIVTADFEQLILQSGTYYVTFSRECNNNAADFAICTIEGNLDDSACMNVNGNDVTDYDVQAAIIGRLV